jgi:hypothetical protein
VNVIAQCIRLHELRKSHPLRRHVSDRLLFLRIAYEKNKSVAEYSPSARMSETVTESGRRRGIVCKETGKPGLAMETKAEDASRSLAEWPASIQSLRSTSMELSLQRLTHAARRDV